MVDLQASCQQTAFPLSSFSCARIVDILYSISPVLQASDSDVLSLCYTHIDTCKITYTDTQRHSGVQPPSTNSTPFFFTISWILRK